MEMTKDKYRIVKSQGVYVFTARSDFPAADEVKHQFYIVCAVQLNTCATVYIGVAQYGGRRIQAFLLKNCRRLQGSYSES